MLNKLDQFLFKNKLFKNIFFPKNDLCRLHEIIFSYFEYFCNLDPFYFINEAFNEGENLKNIKDSKKEFYINKIKILKKLNKLQEYVLIKRKINNLRLKYIKNIENKSVNIEIKNKDQKSDDIIDSNFLVKYETYYQINYVIEDNELLYQIKRLDEKITSNIEEIENILSELDTQAAHEIVKYKDFIHF